MSWTFPSPLRLPPSHSSARSVLRPHLGEPPAIVPPPPPVHDPPQPLCLRSVTSSLRWMYSSTRGIVSKHWHSLPGQAWVYLVSILCCPRPVRTLLWNEHIQELLQTRMGMEIASKPSVQNRSGASRLSVAQVSHCCFLVCSLGTDIALSHYPIVIPFLFLSTRARPRFQGCERGRVLLAAAAACARALVFWVALCASGRAFLPELTPPL